MKVDSISNSNTEMIEIGKRWKSLSDSERNKWNDKAKVQKELQNQNFFELLTKNIKTAYEFDSTILNKKYKNWLNWKAFDAN